jgi:UDP-glucose 4-epimerase
MNVMITGGAGGIGSTLALHLSKLNYGVIAYDNLNNGYIRNLEENGEKFCQFEEDDIRNTAKIEYLIENYDIKCIIHLAAITSLPECESNPSECISVNVGGTASVLSAARKYGVKVIVASTSAIYEGNSPDDAPFTESLEVKPRLFYPLSKKLMEDVIQSYITNYDMDITTLRFFNVFGPRQDIHRASPPLINYIVREYAKKRPLVFYSNGLQMRDYVHVNDVVTMITSCINKPESKNQTFNLCTGTMTSVLEIINYAEQAFNTKLVYSFADAPKFWSNYDILYKGKKPLLDEVLVREVNKFALGSFRKANQIIGWHPNTDIENLMIDTMRKNYELYSG